MKKGSIRTRKLAYKHKSELSALEALPENWIGTSDIPEVRDWSDAQRGLFHRPVKQQVALRLDADMVNWFRGVVPPQSFSAAFGGGSCLVCRLSALKFDATTTGCLARFLEDLTGQEDLEAA